MLPNSSSDKTHFSSCRSFPRASHNYLQLLTEQILRLGACQAEYQTPAGQTYILITPSPFAVDILKALQVRVAEIDVLVKELKRMLKGKASVACDKDTKATDSEGED
jgi:hypothetical protein